MLGSSEDSEAQLITSEDYLNITAELKSSESCEPLLWCLGPAVTVTTCACDAPSELQKDAQVRFHERPKSQRQQALH